MTNEETTNRKLSGGIKWLIAILVLFLLVGGVRLALQSDWVLDKSRDFVVSQANQQLNGTLEIGEIRGDLLFGLMIKDVNLKDLDRESIVTIDSLNVRYTLWDLAFSPHRLDVLELSGVKSNLVQDSDSVWNVEKLIDPAEDVDEEESDPVYWSLDRLILNDTNVSVDSELLLPDRYINIQNLSMQAGVEMLEDGWLGFVDHLDLEVAEGRLPEPIAISMRGGAIENRVTLESLVMNTGRSLLETNADLYEMDRADGSLSLQPISRQDIAAYVDDLPLQQDLNMSLTFGGNFSEFNISLEVLGEGLEQLNLSATADLSDPYVLKNVDLNLENFNGPLLTGLDELPTLDTVSFNGSGAVDLMDLEAAQFAGELRVDNIRAADQQLDRIAFNYNLDGGSAELDGSVQKNGEEIALAGGGTDIFSDVPSWHVNVRSSNMNLANWLDDPELDSDLTITMDAVGSGISPENLQSELSLLLAEGRFGEQHFREFRFDGEVSPNVISGYMSGALDESELLGDFTIREWSEDDPTYDFDVSLNRFNAAELNGLEELPTFINGNIRGSGRSFDLERLTLDATAGIDSTIVAGEQIETLRADFSIRDQFLSVENALLESPIADADFSLYQFIPDYQHLDNRLDFSAEIKNLQSLAPLFGVESLSSEGTIDGQLGRNANDQLEFNSTLQLQNVEVDTLFSSEEIRGSAKVLLLDEIEAETDLEFYQPNIAGVEVQDVRMGGSARLGEEQTTGRFGFELINGSDSRLAHSGEYRLTDEEFSFRTNELEFETPLRVLSLYEPFDLRYADDVLQVDTLQLQSSDMSAYLKLWAPHVDSLRQDIGLDAQNLDVGSLIQTVMDDSPVEGYLSGLIQLRNSPDELYLSADARFDDLRTEDGQKDSLSIAALIEDEWLDIEVDAHHQNQQLLQAHAKVPFIPGDPVTFDDQFFDREIDGEFILFDSDIRYWLSFLPVELDDDTDGTVSFNGKVAGLAGQPEFDGDFKFTNGRFSGVGIDSLGVDLFYNHDESTFSATGSLTSMQQKMLDFNGKVPFRIDLQEFEVLLPADDDSVNANVETRNFDLAILNDFVDRDVIRQVQGTLNGEVQISGTVADVQPTGRLDLTNGSMRIVEAGITVTDIISRVNFRNDRVELQQYSMRSGPGRVRANGTIALENLVPGDVNLNVNATQFRAANTSDYNAVIDLTSTISGTFDEPVVRGSLSVLSGFVNLQNFGDRAVEDVRLEGEEEDDPMAIYDAMEIEMDVNFRRQFFIRNRQFLDMEIELGGQVDLIKRPYDELEMFGQVEGVRGYARPLGRNFEIDEAFVTFSGPVIDPELNVRTFYRPPQARTEVRIFYIIEGTAQDPSFRFDSEPQMELEDIISYTVFGRPFYELESWEQMVAGSGGGPTAADVALDVLLDRVEMLAAQRLGIDVVQIDNSRSGSSSSTSITTGWFLNPRTFFALVNEVNTNPKTLFILEYMLTDNLELILTQGNDSREGIDLRWQYDY